MRLPDSSTTCRGWARDAGRNGGLDFVDAGRLPRFKERPGAASAASGSTPLKRISDCARSFCRMKPGGIGAPGFRRSANELAAPWDAAGTAREKIQSLDVPLDLDPARREPLPRRVGLGRRGSCLCDRDLRFVARFVIVLLVQIGVGEQVVRKPVFVIGKRPLARARIAPRENPGVRGRSDREGSAPERCDGFRLVAVPR